MTVQPLSDKELRAIRRWHERRTPNGKICKQGDPWPCRTARFLATLDAKKAWGPSEIAAWYSDRNDRLDAEIAAKERVSEP